MESNFNQGERVVYIGDATYSGKIGTIVNFRNDTGFCSVQFRTNYLAVVAQEKLRKIPVDESIKDGVMIHQCYARPIRTSTPDFIPNSEMFQPHEIDDAHEEGLVLKAHKNEHKYYFISHGNYKIVPNVKEAWMWSTELPNNEKGVEQDTLIFDHFSDGTVYWKNSWGALIRDSLVRDDITSALDLARLFIDRDKIKVKPAS